MTILRAVTLARFAIERFFASAHAGQWLPFRKRASFRVRPTPQDDVLLLAPAEPSLSFYYVPLCILAVVVGAGLGALT